MATDLGRALDIIKSVSDSGGELTINHLVDAFEDVRSEERAQPKPGVMYQVRYDDPEGEEESMYLADEGAALRSGRAAADIFDSADAARRARDEWGADSTFIPKVVRVRRRWVKYAEKQKRDRQCSWMEGK